MHSQINQLLNKLILKNPLNYDVSFLYMQLSLIHYDCKCGHKFCQKHLNPHSHNCKFDYCKEKKETLEKNNPKIEVKFVKIGA